MTPSEVVELAKKTYRSGVKSCPAALGIVWDDGKWKPGPLGCCGLGAAVLATGSTQDSDVCGILGITDDQFSLFATGFDGGGACSVDRENEWESAGFDLRDWTTQFERMKEKDNTE